MRKKKVTSLPLQAPVRVRLEYSARESLSGRFSYRVDKKLTALEVLLTERFQAAGKDTFRDWLRLCAEAQQEGGGHATK